MYWTEAWVAILTAGLAYALWRLRGLKKELRDGMALKADKKFLGGPRLRARRVKPTKPLYDYGSGEVIGHECPKCGARVAEMGHTVAACEDCQAAAEVIKAGMEAATSGMEIPGTLPNK